MIKTDHPTTVLLVDDHSLVRDGVRGILESQPDLRVVGQAGDSPTAVAHAAAEQPDVVLLDIAIPGGEAAATVRQILSCSPQSSIIVLSMHESPQLVQAMVAAGVRGYLLKTTGWEELVVAIRSVAADSDRVVLDVSRDSLRLPQQEPGVSALSAREREVLALMAEGLSNRQIAARLVLTEATVKRHIRNVFVKLGAVSRIDALNKAAALPEGLGGPRRADA